MFNLLTLPFWGKPMWNNEMFNWLIVLFWYELMDVKLFDCETIPYDQGKGVVLVRT